MHHGPRERKTQSVGLHRLHDVSHIKLMDIFKSLRYRRLRKDVSRRTSHSRTHAPLVTNHDFSPVAPLPLVQSQILSPSSSLYVLHSPSDATSTSILSVSEEDPSSGMSVSISIPHQTSPELQGGSDPPSHSVPVLPSSPSMFHLRSESTNDYLVERLEQHLRRLSLADASPSKLASSVDRVALPGETVHDSRMDISTHAHSLNPRVEPRVEYTTSPPVVVFGASQGSNSSSFPHDEPVVPMIVITSVDAMHTKPPPSPPPPLSKTPFGQFNFPDLATSNEPLKFKSKIPLDDPFTTPPTHHFAYPHDHNLAFRLPPFPSFPQSAGQYSPETPTPMNCHHFGACSGDLWEVLHPPLLSGLFTLPPFELPPLSTSLFDGMLTSPVT